MVFKVLNIQKGQSGLMSLNPKGEELNVSEVLAKKTQLAFYITYCNLALIIVLSSSSAGP